MTEDIFYKCHSVALLLDIIASPNRLDTSSTWCGNKEKETSVFGEMAAVRRAKRIVLKSR